MDGFPSGQRGQTVNLLQIASVVRIHLHPFDIRSMSNEYAHKSEGFGACLPLSFGRCDIVVYALKVASLQYIVLYSRAGVAELADAQDLKSCGTYTPVPVRFRSPAVKDLSESLSLFLYCYFRSGFCFWQEI